MGRPADGAGAMGRGGGTVGVHDVHVGGGQGSVSGGLRRDFSA